MEGMVSVGDLWYKFVRRPWTFSNGFINTLQVIYPDLCNIFFPGANTGIGKETALDLAKRGARLILLCRNVDKAKKAAEHIKKTHNGAQIAVHQLDLASLKSVRNCAQTLIDTEDKIDILVNNAGEILLEINLLLKL